MQTQSPLTNPKRWKPAISLRMRVCACVAEMDRFGLAASMKIWVGQSSTYGSYGSRPVSLACLDRRQICCRSTKTRCPWSGCQCVLVRRVAFCGVLGQKERNSVRCLLRVYHLISVSPSTVDLPRTVDLMKDVNPCFPENLGLTVSLLSLSYQTERPTETKRESSRT